MILVGTRHNVIYLQWDEIIVWFPTEKKKEKKRRKNSSRFDDAMHESYLGDVIMLGEKNHLTKETSASSMAKKAYTYA